MNLNKKSIEVFLKNFGKIHGDDQFWINASNDKEPLVNVLTLHLMSENFLEAYICFKLNISDLFDTKIRKENGEEHKKEALKLQFNQKLKFSRILGLPQEVCEFFDKLNLLRNKFAHDLNARPIENSFIESLINIVNRLEPDSEQFNTQDENITFYDKSGKQTQFIFNDENTPNTIRLTLLYAFLIRRIIIKICK